MGMDQAGTPVLSVIRNEDGGWEVRELGFEEALSAFDSMTEAKAYADGIARTKPGILVEVYGENGELQSRASPAD